MVLSVFQLDHYPVSTYTLPEACDGRFRMAKSFFLGKVFGECLKKWRRPGSPLHQEEPLVQWAGTAPAGLLTNLSTASHFQSWILIFSKNVVKKARKSPEEFVVVAAVDQWQ